MDYELETSQQDTPEQIEVDPAGVVRRWVLELKLADKREREWRKKAVKVWDRYRQKEAKKYSFNILWSNTETLHPAVYNSLPKPDVRRRFKDDDPLGKQVSTVLSRALEFGLDTTNFDQVIKDCALDMLVPGRGVARVRYVPTFSQLPLAGEDEGQGTSEALEGDSEALEGDSEELEWEQVPVEHIQWDDFRHGAGKEWSEVCWVGFRHRLTRDELVEKFGDDIGSRVKLDSNDDEEIEKERDDKVANAFRTAEVWEFWDKYKREVVFIAPNFKEGPLGTVPDPLNLVDFFPIPRPIYAVSDSGTLIPCPLYELYKEQAEELDNITNRINRIVNGLKMRGIYDATLTELSELMRGEDNDLIPAQNVNALLDRGGLEKAIWFLPIDMAAKVLQVLYQQRDAAKQIIYEITGIADIVRGASVASETATAQEIKDKWGSMRLKKMQSEVARFIRDLIRMQAEIIGEKFSSETLETMTGVKLPHQEQVDQQKEMMEAQYQQAVIMAQQQGQQPPPPPQQQPDPITWEVVMQVLRDDKQRTFKVDVETDSTVAASVESDMRGLTDVLTAVTNLVNGLGPAVQMGAMPVEALKEIILSVVRRAKMGNAVEDALDKIQQPQPQQNENDNSAQVAQIKAETDKALQAMKMQNDQQLEAMRISAEQTNARQDAMLEIILANIKKETALEVAEIGAQKDLSISQVNAAQMATENRNANV